MNSALINIAKLLSILSIGGHWKDKIISFPSLATSPVFSSHLSIASLHVVALAYIKFQFYTFREYKIIYQVLF